MKLLPVALLVGIAASASFADSVTLTLLPGPTLSGAPGSTVGWGYTITNSTTNWVQTMGLSSTSFPAGLSPLAIFDYPAIAPNSSVTEFFSLSSLSGPCVTAPCGLYEVVIASNASATTLNGSFTLSADFFSGDPRIDSVDIGAAPNAIATYSLTVSPGASVPEPASGVLMFTAAVAGLLVRRRAGRMPVRN
jgi:PEP-CTERM motif